MGSVPPHRGAGGSATSAPGLRGVLATGVLGKIAEAVTLVLLATVVPRLLGPSDYGRFSVALTVVTIGSVALTVGGATVLARYVPAAEPADRVPVAIALTRGLARDRGVALTVLAVLAAVLASTDPGRFPLLPTVLVLLALGLNVATTLALQADLGLGRAGAWCARYPVQNAVLIVAVLALHTPAGVTGAVAAIVVAAVAGAVLATIAVAPLLRSGLPAVALPAGASRFGWMQASGGALTQLAQRGGVIAVALLAGAPEQVGFAALAIGIALALTYAVAQLFTVALPVLAGRQLATDGAGSEPALRRLAGLLLAVVVPVTIVAVLVVGTMVPLVFGPAYAGAADAFGPAMAMVVLAPVNALAVQAAALRLRAEVTVRAAAVGALAFVLVAALAVPAWGAVGATAAALAGAAASASTAIRMLPGAVGVRLAVVTFGGAAAAVALGLAR